MKAIVWLGRYLWRFFVGDIWQLACLAIAVLIVALLRPALGAVSGVLAFVLVAAVVWTDVFRRAAAQRKSTQG